MRAHTLTNFGCILVVYFGSIILIKVKMLPFMAKKNTLQMQYISGFERFLLIFQYVRFIVRKNE